MLPNDRPKRVKRSQASVCEERTRKLEQQLGIKCKGWKEGVGRNPLNKENVASRIPAIEVIGIICCDCDHYLHLCRPVVGKTKCLLVIEQLEQKGD